MSWQQGRDVVDGLLDRRELEQVLADPILATAVLEQARRHLGTAQREAALDPYVA